MHEKFSRDNIGLKNMKAQQKILKLKRRSHFSFKKNSHSANAGTTNDPTTITATTITTTHVFRD
jgi:hypothetical protein